jgi:GNAT superfamily N-acetyltransferase
VGRLHPAPKDRQRPSGAAVLVPVDDAATRGAAESLIREYLQFIADTALQSYHLTFDIEAMIASDLGDAGKFYPPAGRFYLVRHGDKLVGVGCLKRLTPEVAEIQRMYVQASARGLGAGRLLVDQLLSDARSMQFRTVRLESLRALSAAHALYRSVGFREIEPYAENSMRDYQSAEAMSTYRLSAIFLELTL